MQEKDCQGSEFTIKIKSKVFDDLFHFAEVNLYCYEKLNGKKCECEKRNRVNDNIDCDLYCNENLSDFDDFQMASEKKTVFFPEHETSEFKKYPDCFDVWKCCNIRWSRYSELIDHIEHFHFLYGYTIQNNEQVQKGLEKPYKYQCSKCNKKVFSIHTALRHFIDAHVDHMIMCTQCVVMHSEEGFHSHVQECNVVEFEIKNGK